MRSFKKFCEYCWESGSDEVIVVKLARDNYLVGTPPFGDTPAIFVRQESSLPALIKELRMLANDRIRVVSYRKNGVYSIPDPDKIKQDESLDY